MLIPASLHKQAEVQEGMIYTYALIDEAPEVSYTYAAELVRVIDGDTVELDVDLGFGHWLRGQIMRLHGINTPETRTRDLEEKAKGKAATEWLRNRLNGEEIVVQSIQNKNSASHDSFGRWLAVLFVDGKNINKELVETGHAEIYAPKVAGR